MKRLAVLTLLSVFLFVPAAHTSTSDPSGVPVVVRLLTDKEWYEPGEDVKIEIQAINLTDQDITLGFPTGRQADYWIDGEYVWSDDKEFVQAFTSVDVPARGTYSWPFVHTADDYALTPGLHVINGMVVGCGIDTARINVGQAKGLEITVSTDKESYSADEAIPIHLTVTNVSESEIVLEFTTGKQAGYVIDNEYRWFNGSDLTDVATAIPLLPGESHTWEFVHDPDDYPLTPGTHTIRGIVVGYGHSEAMTISVVSEVEVTVTTDKNEYGLGEPVEISVTATNSGPEAVTLHFDSVHQAGYIIDGIFRSFPEYSLSPPTSVTIEAGESKTWTFSHNTETYPLSPGEHSIVGVVIGYGRSAPTEIFVAGEGTPIEVSVSTDRESYRVGQPVTVEIAATNTSEEPVALRFPTLHQADYQIDEEYLWSEGKFFLPITTFVTLPPGGQIRWRLLHPRNEYPLLPGEHSIVGIVVGYGRSEPWTFVVNEKEPWELTVQGLLVKLIRDGDDYNEFQLYTREGKVYYLIAGDVGVDELSRYVNMTVEVTGVEVCTLIPVPGIPIGVTSITPLLRVEVETNKAEYYQGEDIEITVIARNLQADEPFTLYVDPGEDVRAWVDNIRVPPVQPASGVHSYDPIPIEIPGGGTYDWKLVYSGEPHPLLPGEHLVAGEIEGYGKSDRLPIRVIEQPSERIVAQGIVNRLEDGSADNSGSVPRYVLVDGKSGETLYLLRNPMIQFDRCVGQFVEVVGVLCSDISDPSLTIEADDEIPELFVLRIRRLLAVAVSTDKIAYSPEDSVNVYITAKNCTPKPVTLAFASDEQAYYSITPESTGDGRGLEVGEGTEVTIEPYGLHVWKFTHDWLEPPEEGSYTVRGGVLGYGAGKPVSISIEPEPRAITVAKGVVEMFWWWKWIGPITFGEIDPAQLMWTDPCPYVLFDPEEKQITYFLESDRVELGWYVGRYVEVTGYAEPSPLVCYDYCLAKDSDPNVEGEPGPWWPFPPILPPWPWPDLLNVVSVLPLEEGLAGDADGNGLPDAWEIITGLDEIGAGREEDSDGDGMSNFREYFCGTDPLDADSVVRVRARVNSAGMATLRWRTAPGRTYSIYCADGPSNGGFQWRLLLGGIEGTGDEFAWTDDGAPDVLPPNAAGVKCRFYRVVVE